MNSANDTGSSTRFPRAFPLLAVSLLAVAACSIDESEVEDQNENEEGPAADMPGLPPLDPTDPNYGLKVAGSVFDFRSGAPISGVATIGVSGVQPLPTVSVAGPDFTIDHVPPASVFFIVAGAVPSHRPTYNLPNVVETTALSDVRVETVAEADLAEMFQRLGHSPASGTGVVLARIIDAGGQPRADVSKANLAIEGAAPRTGPFFLDEAKRADAQLERTSRSGYAVFFDVPEGLVTVGGSGPGPLAIARTQVPVAANGVSLVELSATDTPPLPVMDVSFARDVVPALERRSCDQCHSGNGPGRDLGALTLNGATNLMYRELVEELSPYDRKPRVDLANPELSAILTLPLLEDPADRHPNITFRDASDRDYQMILQWIREGARLD